VSDVRIELNSSEIRRLLLSADVENELMARAQRIAAAAGPGMEASTRRGRGRALAQVRTETVEARRAEATDRALTRAIDSGR
jgi:hypothetical protein